MPHKSSLHVPENTTILIAEDDELTLRMITKMIKSAGYQIIPTMNGKEALEAYKVHKPDMVLLDAMMPVLDGFAACEQLNKLYGEACSPVIMVTALGDKKSITQALEAGAFDYVTKPFNAQILRNRIMRLMDVQFAQKAIEQRNDYLESLQRTIVERNRFLESLSRVSEAINSTLNRQDMLSILAESLVRQLDATSAQICELDVGNNVASVLSAYVCDGASEPATDYLIGQEYFLDDYPNTINLLINSHDNYTIHHIDEDSLSKENSILVQYGIKTVLYLHLIYNNDTLGYIIVWNSAKKYDFSEQQLRLAVAFANQATQSFHNATLYQEIQETAKELEIRNYELDAYNHTVAHDLKNPLNIIISYTSLASMKVEDSPQIQLYLERIEQSAYRMSDMIDQLLLLSTINDANALIKPVNMFETTVVSRDRFVHLIFEHDLQVDIADNMPFALGHAPWLEEVFANLIGNAIKYRDHAKDKTRIQIRSVMVGTDAVRYEVQDNGIGIKNEERDQLFQMFSRLDSTPADVKGFGLGLSIIKRIIDKLNGKVGMDSIHGEGSTFWFELPLAN